MASERVQRRLAAILAADIAGYSRLTAADEEGTLARLRALREELIDPGIGARQGRVVKTTGDGLLVEFASVVDAVRCAVGLQRALAERNAALPAEQRIDFRMGINLGDVVVEGEDILGDGVNIAARLEGMAEPGGICLSRAAYEQSRGKVAEHFTDLGERALKNIADPVHVYAVAPPGGGPGAPFAAAPESPPRAPRQSIVVLPFANLGGDKAQDYFVDGITEGLTTDLSRVPGAFVIARNTAFAYRDKARDARQIGRELGVRYVMEGSVQSGADRVRVNAQLIDAETGAHLWAERFDKPRADLFDMQDEITARLARSLDLEMIAAEGRRAERERPNAMDSVDLYLRGWAIWNQPPSSDRIREARRLFEAALALDPRNVDALIGLAGTHLTDVMGFISDNRPEQVAQAEAAIDKAVSLAPNHPYAHHCRGQVLYAQGAPEAALREFELALALDRNLVWSYAMAGLSKIFLGRAEETEADVANAIRLSPREPALGTWHLVIGVADLFLGRLVSAVEQLRRSAGLNPNFGLTFVFLATAFALKENGAEAAEAWAAGHRLLPHFTIATFRRDTPSGNPVYLAQRERVCDGMRLAGIPEGGAAPSTAPDKTLFQGP
ncbi:MAG TPA: tetratricopeptide repeat protein [Stellaceae bacterium]|nr:tetratricopeptide repeat protein [Stellaceae bacterium]